MKKTFLFLIVALMTCNSLWGQTRLCESLDNGLWDKSQWISATDAKVVTEKVHWNSRAADGASWFVASHSNRQKVKQVKWMTTGLGVYDLYVNGKLIGDEVLKPGFTHVFKTRRSFTYDITSAVVKNAGGENQFAAQVTPGWWGDKIVTNDNQQGFCGTKTAFRSVVEFTYADGSKEYFGTDTDNWKAGIAGPVTHAAIFDGEDYDARIPQGYMTVDKLSKPEENKEFRGEILPTNGAEVYQRYDIALKPTIAYIWKDTQGQKDKEFGTVVKSREYRSGETMTVRPGETLVIDFGQNSAAVPSFTFRAKEGTVLTCLPAELLNDGNGAVSRGMDGPEGSVHRTNLRFGDYGMWLKYTFASDNGFVSFVPRNTFYGYRYVSITATDEVAIKSITSVPVTSISKSMETGTITTGDASVNQLISNTLWGERSNYLSVPTDCPQRNERLGWMADTQVFAETGSFFANTDNFFHKWMRDVRDSQGAKGGFTGVSPHGQYGDEKMRIGWADAGVIVPWTVWKQFGDTDIISENWEAMDKYFTHVNDYKYRHQAYLDENRNYQWADWLSYEPLETCGNGYKDKKGIKADAIEYWNYLGASYWAIDAQMMADMAMASGRDASEYEKAYKNAQEYIRDTYMKVNGEFKTDIFNTMQTPALFALKNHLVEGEARDEMIARLRKNFEDHGNCLQTGFLGTSILMKTLTENGMSDVAYTLLFQRKNPSWLYSVDNGATTMWERWNSYMKDKGMGPKGMNSFNHYAYGCVCEWIWETVAGIAADTAQPGFRHIIMKPVPDRRLGHVNATYNSAAGTIKSSWKYNGNRWTWTFTIPKGATATVTLPGETESKDYTSGTYTVSRNLDK